MQLLTEAHSREDAEAIRSSLENKGIPIYIVNSSLRGPYPLRAQWLHDDQGNSFPEGIARRYDVWVCLERQFEDARVLLQNPYHVVTEPVDVAHYHAALDEAQKQQPWSVFAPSTRTLNLLSGALVIAILIVATVAILRS
jgi:hypothetical protein